MCSLCHLHSLNEMRSTSTLTQCKQPTSSKHTQWSVNHAFYFTPMAEPDQQEHKPSIIGHQHPQSIINGTNMVSIQINMFVCAK